MTLQASNCSDTCLGCHGPLIPVPRTFSQRMLESWKMLEGAREAPAEAAYHIHPLLIRHATTAFTDLVVFQQLRTEVARNQIPKLTLVAAASLYDEDVSVFNKPVSQRGQS